MLPPNGSPEVPAGGTFECIVQSEVVDDLKALVRKDFSQVLIGQKELGGGRVALAFTPYSLSPQSLAKLKETLKIFTDRLELSSSQSEAPSLADLVAKVKQSQDID